MRNGRSRSKRDRWGGMPLILWMVVLGLAGNTACSVDGLLNSDKLPSNVSDPALTKTPAGALQAYVGTLAQFRRVFGEQSGPSFIAESGMLSDELTYGSSLNFSSVDERALPEGLSSETDQTYSMLHQVRGRAAQAIGLLTAYQPAAYSMLHQVRGRAAQAIGLLTAYQPAAPALRGHLYALEGYAEVFLAELFCSGVPLGTLDYNGDFTYKPGSSTAEVLTHAVSLFDTALALAGDSARVMTLAQLGRGRALLGLGDYVGAAAATAAVADAYRYEVTYSNIHGTAAAPNFASWYPPTTDTTNLVYGVWLFSVPDREGGNGMAWRTSGDPRTPIAASQVTGDAFRYYPANYDTLGSTPLVLASGVEARLIGAEAQLQADPDGGPWLTTLNALRTDGTFTVDTQIVAIDNTVTPPDTTFAYDTLWHAGSGGVAGLAPLADPGSAAGRVDLLFHERAFWLFLTGHRQGDLRRLIRQYNRQAATVYPVVTP